MIYIKYDNTKGYKVEIEHLLKIIKSIFLKYNVNTSTITSISNNELMIGGDEKSTILSKIDNYILLKSSDKRIKKLKRNYLKTSKPTKEQLLKTLNDICIVFEDLETPATIKYTYSPIDYEIMNPEKGKRKNIITQLLSNKKFPKTKEETENVRKKFA